MKSEPIIESSKVICKTSGAAAGGSSLRSGVAYRISPHARASVEKSKVVILDTRAGQLYGCTGVRAEFWRRLSKGESPDAVVAAISKQFSKPANEVQEDFAAFAEELLERGLLLSCRAKRVSKIRLTIQAVWELFLYDLRIRTFGFRRIYSTVKRLPCPEPTMAAENNLIQQVVAAISTASSLYWLPVRCLQRSVATTRLLRSFGVPARLTIGYRSNPFLSHAWVEVGGLIVNDSTALGEHLTVLDRI